MKPQIQHDTEAAVEEWRDRGKSKDYLFVGRMLKDAKAFQKQEAENFTLSNLASDFTQKSIQQRRDLIRKSIQQRRNKPLKLISCGCISLVVLGVFLGVFWERQMKLKKAEGTRDKSEGTSQKGIGTPPDLEPLNWSSVGVLNPCSLWSPEVPGRLPSALCLRTSAFSSIKQYWDTVEAPTGQSESPARISALQEPVELGVSLTNLPLSGAKLTGANLIGANLSNAKPSSTKPSSTKPSSTKSSSTKPSSTKSSSTKSSSAKLSSAKLSGADLSNAKLTGANLIGANLSNAKLIGADLSNAKLTGANLIGADLSNAKLTGANLIGANLSNAKLKIGKK